MKAKLKAKILSMKKTGPNWGTIEIVLDSHGKVQTSNISAQDITLGGTITLKSLIADEMKIGSALTITISDEEPEDGLI